MKLKYCIEILFSVLGNEQAELDFLDTHYYTCQIKVSYSDWYYILCRRT